MANTKIRCKYLDCAFLDENYCTAAMIELDSDKGCLTYVPQEDTPLDDLQDDIEQLEGWDEEEENPDVDEDATWLDEEEDEEDDYN